MKTRGIILLGGKGNRLKPLTKYISKHLLPVYNKPMVYYSLSSLVYSNISEILIISNKNDLNIYQKLLKPIAKKYNIKFSFEFQKKIGGGIAESLLIGAKFINDCEKEPLSAKSNNNFSASSIIKSDDLSSSGLIESVFIWCDICMSSLLT